MSTKLRPRHGRSKSEYIETARLDVLVPQSSTVNIVETISNATEGDEQVGAQGISALRAIPQRKFLFYDETLTAYVVLEQPLNVEESRYNAYLARIAISLEVTAVDGQRRHGHENMRPGNEQVHLLYQTTIDESQTERIEIKTENRRLALWKVQIPLGHPKAKLTYPDIVLAASAVLKQAEQSSAAQDREYIDSWQPFGENLLDAFVVDPKLSNVHPMLSTLRVSRTVPHSRVDRSPITPLGFSPKRSFPVYPAIIIRLRYSRLISGNRQDVIASLDIEVTSFGECSVRVEEVDIKVSEGTATLLGDSPYSQFPIECHPKDDITLLYSLEQTDLMRQASASDTAALRRPISVSLKALAFIGKDCTPLITTQWDTVIDFATPIATPSALGSGRRPSSQSLPSFPAASAETLSSAPGIQPRRHKSHRQNQSIQFALTPDMGGAALQRTHSTEASGGLTITFSGPARVHVGEVFTWNVFVFNQGAKQRKFVLVVAPKRRKGGEGKVLPALPQDGNSSGVVLDENSLFTLHRGSFLEPVDLIPLDNDVRVGPLAPFSCHTMELRFLPLATGVLGVEGIRVVDLFTNETTDCRDLPSIVSVEAETGA